MSIFHARRMAGCAAGFLSLASGALADSVVVFNEIHYHPDTAEASREYLELHNQMSVDVDLSGWEITGGVNYTFPEGTIIPGRGYLVVAAAPAGVASAYGAAGALGPWTGRLSNSGEDLHLRDNNGREMDEVVYDTGGKWPAGPDGAGPSLTKRSANAASGEPVNWVPSWQNGGTPGTANFPDPNAPFVAPAGLVSWWPMNEAAGTAVQDAAGGNNGAAGAGVSRVAGLTGSAARQFDNTGTAWLNAGAGGNFAVTGGITIEAVFKSSWDGTGTDTLLCRNNQSLPTALTGWYAFNESAAGTAAAMDAAGGAAGSFSGTATRTAGRAGSTGAAKFNNAGTDGVNIGAGAAFTTGLTISAWIKPGWSGLTNDYDEIFRKEDGGNRILFSFQNDVNNGGASPPVAAGPVLSFGLNTGGYKELDMPLDGNAGRPTLAQLKDGNWHHVAATYDAATGLKALYIDGTLRHSVTHSGNIVSGGGAAGLIGNTGTAGGEPFTGEIDDFALFRVALTAGQIASLAGDSADPATVLPGVSPPEKVLLALQNDGNNGTAMPPVAAGPVLSFGLNTGGAYSELDMPLDGAAGRPTLAELTNGQEHHVAATYDAATGNKQIYIDGTLRYSATRTGTVAAGGTAPVVIGNSGPGGPDAWNGVIDEAAYWSRALTVEEVQQHWAKTVAGTDYFALPQTATTPPALRINETGAGGSFFVELQNTGTAPLEVTGFIIRVSGATGGNYVVPAQTLAAGGMLTVTAAQLGFNPEAGAKVFILTADGNQLTDSAEVETNTRGRTAAGDWAAVSAATPGAANTFTFRNDVVISEIMYHPRPAPGSPAVTQDHVLVPLTAAWKYLDNGQDPGAQWKEAAYNDSAWPSGTGMLGSTQAGGAYQSTVAADNPLAWWRLDDAGGAIADASGHGRNGTATAGMVLGTDPLVADGAGSRAAGFSGANRITIPGFEKIGTAGYSAEYWVKVVTPPATFVNLLGDGDSGGDFFMMNYLSPGSLIRPHYGTANAPVSLDAATALVTGQVYHVVTTWDTASATGNGIIYINGVADTTGTVTRNLPGAGTTGNNTVYIGYDNREPGAGSFVLDEVALYDHPLSAARVAAHYNAGSAPSPRNTTLATGAVTHYFRTGFNFTGNPAATSLSMNLAVDDGAVVYLNGVELRRENMPDGMPGNNTRAATERSGVTFTGVLPVPAAALRNGMNVVAVAVHQAEGSQDVFMGLELTAQEITVPAVTGGDTGNTWLELHNRGTAPADLTGWRLDDGTDFRFAAGTSIPAGGWLVVASDLVRFAGAYPGKTAVGPVLNNFSKSGERILLRDAAGNVADSVSYLDSGRWPAAADGGGSSLELLDARSDNNVPESWAASDESGQSAWQEVSYRATAGTDGGPANWNEFVLGLLDEGEVLLDDIHVVSQPDTGTAAEIVAGGDFENGAAAWRMLGTHRTSAVIAEPGNPGNKVLRVTSTGSTDVLHNHIEVTLNNNTPVVNGRVYEIRYRAKWQGGSNLLNTRLYWNRCAKTTALNVPAAGGTPGAANTRVLPNAGPTFTGLRHEPAVPAPAQACTVTVAAGDPDNVASMTLRYAVAGGAWQSAPMTAAGGMWSAALPGQAAGAVVQFYVEAADGAGATAAFPAAGEGSRALVQWDNGQANVSLAHNLRLIMTAADRTLLFTPSNLLADDRVGCTVVYDESEVFYDAGVRLKGSEHGRADSGRQSYNISFSPDHKFRGVHDSVLLDRSGGWRFGRTTGQDEILVKNIINHAGGVASLHDDLVRMISPQAGHTGPALLQMARYSGDYLDSMYQDGSDGHLYKMEVAYHVTGTANGQPTGLKVPQEGSVSNLDLGERGADKENYRWFYQHDNNREDDAFAPVMDVVRAFAKNGTAFDQAIDPLIDNDEWMRCMALESLCGITDIFSRDNGHNVYFYQRPKDGKVLLLPWDWDFAFNSATNAPLWGPRAISKAIQRPHNLRQFYGHLLDIIGKTFNTQRMGYWTAHYDNFTPGQDFGPILTWIGQRAAYVQSQIPAQAVWAVTAAPEADVMVAGGSVAFAGTAPFDHQTVRFEIGGAEPVKAVFSSLSNWGTTVPVTLGRNVIGLRVYDPRGNLIPAASRDFVVIGTSATVFIDENGNGLPDAWEGATGLAEVTGVMAGTDEDGDGMTNLQEYLAGTNPLDAKSCLEVSFGTVTPATMVVRFDGVAGRTYRIQVSSSLGGGDWTTVRTISAQAADGVLNPVIDVPAGGGRVFVRVLTP